MIIWLIWYHHSTKQIRKWSSNSIRYQVFLVLLYDTECHIPCFLQWKYIRICLCNMAMNKPQKADVISRINLFRKKCTNIKLITASNFKIPANLYTLSVDFRFAPSQWETSLQNNAVSHWLGANLKSAMHPGDLSPTLAWDHGSYVFIEMLHNIFSAIKDFECQQVLLDTPIWTISNHTNIQDMFIWYVYPVVQKFLI